MWCGSRCNWSDYRMKIPARCRQWLAIFIYSNCSFFSELSSQSISGSEKIVRSFAPRLRMLQTVDCLLSESNKKPVAKFCRYTKSLRIPGFSGEITTSDKNLPVYTDANKTLLHDLNTVVFVEPTKTISNLDQSCGESRTADSSLCCDSTTVNVVRKLDICPVWIHGPCAIWSPGIYCVQNKLYGLSSTVRESAKSICFYCKRSGATIACKHEKNSTYHFLCCLAEGLILDDSSFMAVRWWIFMLQIFCLVIYFSLVMLNINLCCSFCLVLLFLPY